MPRFESRKRRPKTPDDSPDGIGVSDTCQDWPRLVERNTRARLAPPEATHAFELPCSSSDELLAANAVSFVSICGQLSCARRRHVWPASSVLNRSHLPSGGSLRTSPLRSSQNATPSRKTPFCWV